MQVEAATITWPIWQLALVIIIVFFVGALFGYYSLSTESKNKIREAEEKAEVAMHQARGEIERAAARVAHAEQMAASAPPAAASPGVNLLRLWLDERERPALDLDGQRADNAPFSDAHRKRLIALLNVMRPWIEGKPAPVAPPPAPVAAAPAPQTMPPPAPVTHAPVSRPISTPIPASAAKPIAKMEDKPTAPLSMVGQIDEILQERLERSPLAERGIRLIESPEGGVIVAVGVQRFNGVGEVSDPQIQAELRAAIAEWEKKYTPGL